MSPVNGVDTDVMTRRLVFGWLVIFLHCAEKEWPNDAFDTLCVAEVIVVNTNRYWRRLCPEGLGKQPIVDKDDSG